MRKYELSISADYVPEWGITEAVREFFQNSIDEETRDSSNKMFFDYDADAQIIRIGNKHSDLDIKTLLFGVTTKNTDDQMIGNHGEGYKIATVVLLRMGKTVVFQNYCRKEIWRPRLVNSRRYGGIKVPTFFVEDVPIWGTVPEHSLIIEIGGVTPEEYEEIRESNLHLQEDVCRRETSRGAILDGEEYKGRIFVGGLFICTESRLDIGIDFKPKVVRLERDRTMVNSFDVQWYAARMIEELKDAELTKKSLGSYSGTYINYYSVPNAIRDEITEEFISEHGAKAVPVANQGDMEKLKKKGYKPVIVSEAKRDIILNSDIFEDIREEQEKERQKERPLAERFCEFIEKIESKLSEDEVVEIYGFYDEISDREEGEE
ncbi:MAG: hypothetical protein NC305_17610 [Lachnospiraceae bacterium]|nr:hypothetical protein [Lachnospiraceae bacterium]